MQSVLGLSITSAAVRLVVVEGAAGEGDTVRHDAVDIGTIRTWDEDRAIDLAELVLGEPLVAAARAGDVHSIGVTWTDTASTEGALVLEALAAAGLGNFLAVSECDAAAALASALQEVAGSEDVAVCIVEPDAALVATTDSGSTRAQRITRRESSSDELVRSLASLLEPADCTPEAIFALGSADDLDLVVASLRDAAQSSVVSVGGATVAMARGAALAAAWAISGAEAQLESDDVQTPGNEPADRGRRMPKLTTSVGILSSVLVAAVLTFVVSVSAVLGLRFTSDATPSGADQPAAAAPGAPKAVPQAAAPPAAAPPAIPTAEAPPPPAESVAAEAAPLPEAVPPSDAALVDAPAAAPAPVYRPMEPAPPAAAPAYVPPPSAAPDPAYVPPVPAAPDYVAPGAPAPETQPQPVPRLRDRIIEKIPVLGRFHEPKPQYPQ